jgi:hypothetical protein
VPSSSLIFVLVVAIWAAYLLQHWIRRRDHLSTARSVDRFSEAMRVLERRKPLPESPLAAPEPRSYAVSPARPSRATVTVKRAVAQRPAAPAATRTARATEAPKVRVRGRMARLLSGLTRRRLHGASFVLCLLAVVGSAVLVPVIGLTWWAAGGSGVLLVLDLVWLRHAAAVRRRRSRQEHAARTAHRVRERRVAEASGRRAHQPSPATAQPRRPATILSPANATAARADRHVDTVYDPDAPAVGVEQPAAAAAGPADEPQDRSGDWQPVPVPPPTYTLKARAERPASAPAEVTPTPEPFDRAAADEPSDADGGTGTTGMPTGADGDAPHQGGEAPYGRDLPFDGLALDEELEELPAVYAAG